MHKVTISNSNLYSFVKKSTLTLFLNNSQKVEFLTQLLSIWCSRHFTVLCNSQQSSFYFFSV